jgi:3-phenylpropionate/cinnamic acid dioxygenase small subunit
MSDVSSIEPGLAQVDADTHYRLQAFLFEEAALLDRRAYETWLGLVSEKIQYRVQARIIRDAGGEPANYLVISEDHEMLTRRAKQISTPKLTHAENPPTFTRRFVSNLVGFKSGQGEFVTRCNILIYRHRLDSPDFGIYAGERVDSLCEHRQSFLLTRREVQLDQAVFPGSVSIII